MSHHVLYTTLLLLLLALAAGVTAEPVDTTQFGNVKVGMREIEIRDRLGEPDAIQDQGRSVVWVERLGGRRERLEVRRTTWTYEGNSQVMHTVITFENGVVAAKQKVPASGSRR